MKEASPKTPLTWSPLYETLEKKRLWFLKADQWCPGHRGVDCTREHLGWWKYSLLRMCLHYWITVFNTHRIVHLNLVSLFYVNYTSIKLIGKTVTQGWGGEARARSAGRCRRFPGSSEPALPQPSSCCSSRTPPLYNALTSEPDSHWPFQIKVPITHSPCHPPLGQNQPVHPDNW